MLVGSAGLSVCFHFWKWSCMLCFNKLSPGWFWKWLYIMMVPALIPTLSGGIVSPCLMSPIGICVISQKGWIWMDKRLKWSSHTCAPRGSLTKRLGTDWICWSTGRKQWPAHLLSCCSKFSLSSQAPSDCGGLKDREGTLTHYIEEGHKGRTQAVKGEKKEQMPSTPSFQVCSFSTEIQSCPLLPTILFCACSVGEKSVCWNETSHPRNEAADKWEHWLHTVIKANALGLSCSTCNGKQFCFFLPTGHKSSLSLYCASESKFHWKLNLFTNILTDWDSCSGKND